MSGDYGKFACRTRRCARCGQAKPMKGGHTDRSGKVFRCADCKPKAKPKAAA